MCFGVPCFFDEAAVVGRVGLNVEGWIIGAEGAICPWVDVPVGAACDSIRLRDVEVEQGEVSLEKRLRDH